uniref:Uncharacterized protein n=1 Tax=Anguilla anguilla TaxID=7936 RepID=A0A0E9Q8K1_ANGAN
MDMVIAENKTERNHVKTRRPSIWDDLIFTAWGKRKQRRQSWQP